MKHLEENPQEKVLDVVPVSGLILGRFIRMENELKTVLELWEAKLLTEKAERERAEAEMKLVSDFLLPFCCYPSDSG